MTRSPLIVFSSLLFAALLPAQEPADAAAKSAVDMEKYMAEMMRLATPGKEHAELAKMAGTWDTTMKMRMAPDAPWQEIKGKTVSKTILGGRFVVQETSCMMMGMPMEGYQILGYDNLKQRYTATWRDTWSTWEVSSSGVADEKGVITFEGKMIDVVSPEGRPFKMVVHPKGADESFVEMFDTIDGNEVKVMEILYKRAREKAKIEKLD